MRPVKVTIPTEPFDQLDASNGADPDVLRFIKDFRESAGNADIIRNTFMQGYCYYFAHLLKQAFSAGTVCWCAPYSHFVWCADYNGCTYAYDVEGICSTKGDYYIPEKFLGPFITGFKHTPGKNMEMDKYATADAISAYKYLTGEDDDIS